MINDWKELLKLKVIFFTAFSAVKKIFLLPLSFIFLGWLKINFLFTVNFLGHSRKTLIFKACKFFFSAVAFSATALKKIYMLVPLTFSSVLLFLQYSRKSLL